MNEKKYPEMKFNLSQAEIEELVEVVTHLSRERDFASAGKQNQNQDYCKLLNSLLQRFIQQSDAARDVLDERHRQIEKEGYDPSHDDAHVNDEIAALACFYAMPPGAREWSLESTCYGETLGEAILPDGWVASWSDHRRRELVKAGALILAEIERIDRVTSPKGEEE